MSDRVEEIEIQDSEAGGEQAAAVVEIESRPVVVAGTGEIRSGRLKGLTMWAAIWVLSWPVLTESFLNALVGLVDTTLAAGISEAATSAIGVASYFQWFVGLVAIAIGVGATAMIARSMGKGRVAFAGAVVGQAMLLSVILGTIAGAAIALAAPGIASLMSLSPENEAYQFAVDYLRIVAAGVPAVTILFSGIACCRGAGDSLRPLFTMLLVNIVNVAISFSLSGVEIARSTIDAEGVVHSRTLISNPFPWDLGVHGIAIGTLVAWWIGAITMVLVLIRGTHSLRLRARRLRPHLHTIGRLVRVGLPNFLETFGMWFGNFLTVLMVGWMGVEALYGTHIVAIRIEAFSFLPGFAMATAAATLAGQYLGAGSPALARTAVLRCTTIAALIMGSVGAAFILMPEPIVGIFSQQRAHLDVAPRLLMICGIVQIPFAVAIVVRGSLRGAGDTRWVMLITLFATWCVRLPLAWLFSGVDIPLPGGSSIHNPAPLQTHFDVHPLVGLWIALTAEMAVRPLLFLVRFIQGGWQRVRV